MTFQTEHKARRRQENELRSLGRDLRDVLVPGTWADLAESQRADAVERAFALARERMGVDRETPVTWTLDPKERGYEETTGEIKIPRGDLCDMSPEDAAGLVGHEMRHAWQWEVIEGRTEPPGGPKERAGFAEAHRTYDPCDDFKYAHNELELDAKDRAAFVIEGFRDAAV